MSTASFRAGGEIQASFTTMPSLRHSQNHRTSQPRYASVRTRRPTGMMPDNGAERWVKVPKSELELYRARAGSSGVGHGYRAGKCWCILYHAGGGCAGVVVGRGRVLEW